MPSNLFQRAIRIRLNGLLVLGNNRQYYTIICDPSSRVEILAEFFLR